MASNVEGLGCKKGCLRQEEQGTPVKQRLEVCPVEEPHDGQEGSNTQRDGTPGRISVESQGAEGASTREPRPASPGRPPRQCDGIQSPEQEKHGGQHIEADVNAIPSAAAEIEVPDLRGQQEGSEQGGCHRELAA